MEKEQPKKECKHNFKYSHREFETVHSTIMQNKIDVVVCTKCGLVQRS